MRKLRLFNRQTRIFAVIGRSCTHNATYPPAADLNLSPKTGASQVLRQRERVAASGIAQKVVEIKEDGALKLS